MDIVELLEKMECMERDFTDIDLYNIETEVKYTLVGKREKETKQKLVMYLEGKIPFEQFDDYVEESDTTKDRRLYDFVKMMIKEYKEIKDDFDKMGPVMGY